MRAWLNKNLLGCSIASMLQDFSEELIAVALPVFIVSLVGALLLSLGVNFASVLVLAFILFGASAATVKVVALVYAVLLLPRDMRSTGFALVQTIEGVGDLIASAVVGFLWSYISPFYAFAYFALLVLCAAFLILNIKRIQALFS